MRVDFFIIKLEKGQDLGNVSEMIFRRDTLKPASTPVCKSEIAPCAMCAFIIMNHVPDVYAFFRKDFDPRGISGFAEVCKQWIGIRLVLRGIFYTDAEINVWEQCLEEWVVGEFES